MPNKASLRQTKYDKQHTIMYCLKLNSTTDEVIINKIETAYKLVGSKQGAIKYLLKNSKI